MGRRLENWLTKTNAPLTRREWLRRWRVFAQWVTSTESPLTGRPLMGCAPDEVDDIIRRDFEEMPFHLFQDRYRDILTRYAVSIPLMNNTVNSYVSSVRSFFENEAVAIKLQRGKLPPVEMAMGEHVFTHPELCAMWLVSDVEGKARLSTAVSLGWSMGDFLRLTKPFLANALHNLDEGYACFDWRRKKTDARTRGILNPRAVADLQAYLPRAPEQGTVWSANSDQALNDWLKRLIREAGIRPNGTIRFHLLRKYTYDLATAKCGVYEAKLLVGRRIRASEATYLHGLQGRLERRYRRFAFPLLDLGPQGRDPETDAKLRELTEMVVALTRRIDGREVPLRPSQVTAG